MRDARRVTRRAVVTSFDGPPVAGTRDSVCEFGENTMIPVWLHVPPRALGASASVCAGPPDTSMRFSFPSAKNPSDCPLGDQNG